MTASYFVLLRIDSENSFIYYRNDDGDAVPVAWQPGTELVKILSNLISDQEITHFLSFSIMGFLRWAIKWTLIR